MSVDLKILIILRYVICNHLISDLTADEQHLLHSIQEKKKQLLFEIQVRLPADVTVNQY